MNTASSSGSGLLPSNTVANPRGDLKAITTRSGISYDGPPILPTFSPLPKVVEREPKVTKDMVQPSTENIQPLVVQIQASFDERVVAPKPKPSIPYPSRANKQKLHKKDDNLALKFVKIFRELHFELSFVDALLHMLKFASMFKSLLNNKEKLFDLAKTPVNENCLAVILKKLPEKLEDPGKFLIPCDFPELLILGLIKSVNQIDVINVSCEEYAQKVLSFLDSSKSGNPTPSLDPILSISFPSLTPFEGGDFILEEIEACLTNDSIPSGIDDANFDSEGDLLLLEKLLNDDPSSLLPPMELHFVEIKTIKSSIDDPPELELKDLPSHLEYSFLERTNKFPIIISKELKDEEKALLKVLKSHKWAIAWKISNTKEFDVIIREKKGAKNIMADHLSRLETPHQNVLENKEITKTFPLKTLGMISFRGDSSTPWFVDIANYHARNFIVKGMSSQPEKGNEKLKVSLNIIEERFNYNSILFLSTNEKT
ncbi:hypothetical protein Tco_1570742 [Tanacetum coccineum]